jgi:hypothetical protein
VVLQLGVGWGTNNTSPEKLGCYEISQIVTLILIKLTDNKEE